MVDSIISIRQMMAEANFTAAENLISSELTVAAEEHHLELKLLLLEVLEALNKHIPQKLMMELAELQIDNNPEKAKLCLEQIDEKYSAHNLRISVLKIKLHANLGQLSELYKEISDFQIALYHKSLPANSEVVNSYIGKYFKQDFHLHLQQLAINLLVQDLKKSEVLITELILSCFEKSSNKQVREKLLLIAEILSAQEVKGHLEIYKTFIQIFLDGIDTKKDYKRLAELVIYFDDFRLQAILLSLFNRLNLTEVAGNYATALRQNPLYNFVYLDKHHSELKKFFVIIDRPDENKEQVLSPDFGLESEQVRVQPLSQMISEGIGDEEEHKLIHMFNHRTFTSSQLSDIAVSFLQSDIPKVALHAAQLAIDLADSEKLFLKGMYLKLICLMQLKDFRAALDVSMQGLNKAQTTDDILSFLYCQAEAYSKVNEVTNAKRVFKKILSIDSDYRLTKERLEQLNEI